MKLSCSCGAVFEMDDSCNLACTLERAAKDFYKQHTECTTKRNNPVHTIKYCEDRRAVKIVTRINSELSRENDKLKEQIKDLFQEREELKSSRCLGELKKTQKKVYELTRENRKLADALLNQKANCKHCFVKENMEHIGKHCFVKENMEHIGKHCFVKENMEHIGKHCFVKENMEHIGSMKVSAKGNGLEWASEHPFLVGPTETIFLYRKIK